MNPTMKIGEWEIDPVDGQIRRLSEIRRLRPKAMAVLTCLADNAGDLVERDAIIASVWGRELVTDEPLTTCIAELRRTLEDRASSPRYIQTVPKRGYRLVAEVAGPNPEPDNASTAPPDPPPQAAPVPARGPRHRAVPAMVLIALALALFLYMSPRIEQNPPPPVPPASAEKQIPTIAVLPFVNMSDVAHIDYLGDGIAEEIINSLTRIEGLRVRSRTSSFALRDQQLDAAAIAERMGVTHILEGSIRHDGDTLRISAQLIDVGSDTHVWSEVLNKAAQDVFEIQGDIASRATAALEVALNLEQQRRLVEVGTTDTDAYNHYLRGRQLLARRTTASLEAAAESFEQALALDPQYPQAWVGLADAHLLLPLHSDSPAAEHLAKARASVERALEIDPEYGEAYATLGSILDDLQEFEASEAAFKVALKKAPRYPTTYHWYGFMLYRTARQEEAEEMLRLAVEQDPLSNLLRYGTGANLLAMGRKDEAEALYRQVIANDPEFAWAYEGMGELNWNGRGQLDAAAEWYEKAYRYDPDSAYFQALLGAIHLDAGDLQSATRWIDSAAQTQADSLIVLVHQALLHLYRGEREEAYQIALGVLEDAPRDYLALLQVRNHYLANHQPEAAKVRYAKAFPGLLADDPAVSVGNFQAAVDLAWVLRQLGDTAQADRLLEGARKYASNYPRHGLPYRLSDVKILALEGRSDEALTVLEQSIASGWRPYWWLQLKHDPALQSLRDDARFERLLGELEGAAMAEELRRNHI